VAEIGSPEVPHLADAHTCHNIGAHYLLKAYMVDFHETRSLFAVE
jgi:hypothetical protein